MQRAWNLTASFILCLCMGVGVFADETVVLPALEDQFDSPKSELWQEPNTAHGWAVEDGVLRNTGSADSMYRTRQAFPADVSIDTRVRLIGGNRQTFGIGLRMEDNTYLIVRYYDSAGGMQLLSYHGGSYTPFRETSDPIAVEQGKWYRMKVVGVADQVHAKLWPEDEDEPDWQFQIEVPNSLDGQFALVAHDDTQLEFDWVRANADAEIVAKLKEQAEQREQLRVQSLRKNLRLAVSVSTSPGGSGFRVHVVPFVENDRLPVSGTVTLSWNDHKEKRTVTVDDYQQNGLAFDLPAQASGAEVSVRFETDFGKTLESTTKIRDLKSLSYRDYVQECLDTLIEHGRDDYGPNKTPLFMAVLDADTLRSPQDPLLLDSLVRLEDRIHRRGERGTNLWYDQGLLQCLYRMSELTNDERYKNAADDYVSHFFKHCYKYNDPAHVYLNGMPAWGTHVYWDCYEEKPAGDGEGNGPHEILVYRADWESMYRQDSAAVERLIEGIWRYHIVDKYAGLHNRHDDSRQGCDFSFSGSSFAQAMAFMYKKTGEQRYLDRAKIIVDWHWNNRNVETNLTADSPGLTGRYDGHHCFTTVVGPHALGLLRCYQLTGDPHFWDLARSYIEAYDRYGWNEQEQTYWAMIKLDGTPVPAQPKGSGYDAYAPYGLVDVWRGTIYSYEFTLAAAQAAMAAYEVSVEKGEPDNNLLKIARRWGGVVERSLPANTGRRWNADLLSAMPAAAEQQGAYAEDYGRAISLFVHLHRATGEQSYLDLAESLADEATSKLFRNGVFVGHPAKPYYEVANGVGLLMVSLLELDGMEGNTGGAW
ncbi:hypothetical protein [Aeoliella sp.]|uniref:hypothetical protein n=1 Tax=Aeoliella sp. TaxID=2795800 RepID=UPI003CCBB966